MESTPPANPDLLHPCRDLMTALMRYRQNTQGHERARLALCARLLAYALERQAVARRVAC